MFHLVVHPPLLVQDFSLLVDQRPLLLAQEPLQLLDLVLLAPESLDQLLLTLGQLQLQHKGVFRGKLVVPFSKGNRTLLHFTGYNCLAAKAAVDLSLHFCD